MIDNVGAGKGLHAKSKSAQMNRLSWCVSFTQISDSTHKVQMEAPTIRPAYNMHGLDGSFRIGIPT